MVTVHKITQIKHGKIRVTFLMPTIEGCGCLYLTSGFMKAFIVCNVQRMARGR